MVTLTIQFMNAPYIIYIGKTYQVEWYFEKDGSMPGYEYYRTLSEDTKARFIVLVQHLANAQRGTFLPKTHYNIEDAAYGIYAFKPHSERLLNFMAVGRKIIVTNGFHKQSQRPRDVDKKKIEKAVRIKQDYEFRMKKGAYYA